MNLHSLAWRHEKRHQDIFIGNSQKLTRIYTSSTHNSCEDKACEKAYDDAKKQHDEFYNTVVEANDQQQVAWENQDASRWFLRWGWESEYRESEEWH